MTRLQSFRMPACSSCKHLFDEGTGARCAAFPGGIPDAILDARHDHRDPYPGDNGIRYELAPEYSPTRPNRTA